ncbi:hypothetical protein NXG27_13470 [Megasphaera paucivorans]|uniref:Uncharacterized protein n=1 Tax=Megasphaera paucivorans TaxID=349095 RepID=A0A1G9UDL8_9FIRM|nr:hypothetical protein [Megasphaera paucivorans]SDM58019.1 hypothetical protein SAMN05660299_01155 [Megasphaera paucivorans]
MSKLLINEVPLMCLPSLAVKIGLNEALFIQQLHYWVDRSKNIIDGRQWVYNTMADWSKQFPFWSQKTLSRTISNLEKQKLVISGNYNQKGYDRTKWYTIDYLALEGLEKEEPETKNHEESEPDVSGENDAAVSDQSIGTKCPHEENQGFAGTMGDAAVSDQSIGTKCPHEENQGLADTVGDASVGDQSIETNCPYEEIQGLSGPLAENAQNDRFIGTSCPNPSGHFVPMESNNLSSPIPENNNREFSEKTTTNRNEETVVGDMVNIKNSLDRLLFVMPSYGITLATAKKFIAEYGLEAVEQQWELLKKALQKGKINNPAGWLHMALREGYVDAPAAFKQLQEEKKAAMREKMAEIERQQIAALEREAEEEANQFEIPENSPFHAFLAKYKKEQDEKSPV